MSFAAHGYMAFYLLYDSVAGCQFMVDDFVQSLLVGLVHNLPGNHHKPDIKVVVYCNDICLLAHIKGADGVVQPDSLCRGCGCHCYRVGKWYPYNLVHVFEAVNQSGGASG